jgi:tRNA dimethylallyltransferase
VTRVADEVAYIAIAGPTASGKTAAAMAIARTRPVEIVSVDSALVYRGMDIGTAKPSAAERAEVPHHLIDIRDPAERYSAAAFVDDAQRAIADIRARGKLPLLVGGTMLYFKALIDGLDAMPSADAAVRAKLEAEAAEVGWPAMHAKLAEVDSITAARLAPNDSQRVQRALEVWHASGLPLSHFHAAKAADKNTMTDSSTRDVTKTGSGTGVLFSLETEDRAWLHARIAQRFDAMLADGFLDEVKALRARGDLTPDLPSMRCVGYRQAWEALDGDWPMTELRERGIAATRQLAKRQMTWLRSMPKRRIVACDQPGAIAEIVRQVDAIACCA